MTGVLKGCADHYRSMDGAVPAVRAPAEKSFMVPAPSFAAGYGYGKQVNEALSKLAPDCRTAC
ncbi:hypothetical protein APX81_11725 [Escherichia coli]|nr:hypothetical protein [Escherichia coli]PAZ27475.1 hypothetical protein APU33_00960 [Escherichia coli]PAZ28463.1 hypothetical protein APU34_23320 [Escherichia coli]PAZ33232.1 hypothetical protein APU35_25040 [Escherichia coli]PAZ42861.1 hypothetical protein APU36_00740 [Escherichia coli]